MSKDKIYSALVAGSMNAQEVMDALDKFEIESMYVGANFMKGHILGKFGNQLTLVLKELIGDVRGEQVIDRIMHKE